jgi:hypothetical protein
MRAAPSVIAESWPHPAALERKLRGGQRAV